MMGWYGGGMGWAAWVGMGLFWLVLIGLILFLVVRLLPDGSDRRGEKRETPEEILDRRFARGEVDIETYRAQRAALEQARGGR
jgi:putative membrane protein